MIRLLRHSFATLIVALTACVCVPGCSDDAGGKEGSIAIGGDRDAVRDQILGGGEADKGKNALKTAPTGANKAAAPQ